MNLLKSRRSQSQIITTVLIVLVVLAAVIIVWQVVRTTVTGGTEEIEARAECIGVNLVIANIDNSTGEILIRRDPGAKDIETVIPIIFINGELNTTGIIPLEQLGSDVITISGLGLDDDVQIAANLTEGGLCQLSSSIKVSEFVPGSVSTPTPPTPPTPTDPCDNIELEIIDADSAPKLTIQRKTSPSIQEIKGYRIYRDDYLERDKIINLAFLETNDFISSDFKAPMFKEENYSVAGILPDNTVCPISHSYVVGDCSAIDVTIDKIEENLIGDEVYAYVTRGMGGPENIDVKFTVTGNVGTLDDVGWPFRLDNLKELETKPYTIFGGNPSDSKPTEVEIASIVDGFQCPVVDWMQAGPCERVGMEITDIRAQSRITVQRTEGFTPMEVVGYKIFIDGADTFREQTGLNLGPLESDSFEMGNPYFNPIGLKVQVAPVLEDGTVCSLSEEFEVYTLS